MFMKRKTIILSILVVFLSALSASIFILVSYLFNYAVDKNTDETLKMMLGAFIVLVLMGLTKALFNNLEYKFFNSEEIILKNDVFKGLNKENVDTLKNMETVKFQMLFNKDIYNVVGFNIITIPRIVKIISRLVFMLAAFIYMIAVGEISFIVLFPLIIICGILVPVGIKYNKTSIKHKKIAKEELDKTEKFLAETGEIISLVKAVDAYDSSANYYRKLNLEYLAIKNKTSSVLTIGRTMLYVTSLLIFAFVILMTSYFISKGELRIGSMLFIILIVNNTHRLLLAPVPILNEFKEYKESNDIILNLLKPENNNVLPLGINDFKSIVFENVSFEDNGVKIIDNLSFEIKAGDIVLLKGPAGSGKSIIFKLLLGLIKPTEGNIYLDTVQMRIELGKEESHLFSYVPQYNLLYTASVKDNFLILTRVMDEAKIKEALKMACVLDEIPDLNVIASSLPEDVIQRILIAMAIAKDEKIMLIDGFASILSNKMAKDISSNLATLNKTIIYITDKDLSKNDKVIKIKLN